MRFRAIFFILPLLNACTSDQTAYLGLHQTTLTQYAQYMTDTQLCEVLYRNRGTTQTLASLATEFNRRGLSQTWCDEKLQQTYFKSFVQWFEEAVDNIDPEDPSTTPETLPGVVKS